MEELYENLYGMNNSIIISDEFLNKYLSDADPKYLKVFIFYLWKGVKEHYSIKDASVEIDLSEDDIEMALKYWIRKKLIKKECLITGESEGRSATDNVVDLKNYKTEVINKNRKEYDEVERNLLFVAEKMIGKTLSGRQVDLIATCYNDYSFDESLIHYLFEYCSSISKTDARYMATVASSWYEQNIKTVDDAKKLIDGFKGKTSSRDKKSKIKKTTNETDYSKYISDSVVNGKL